MPDNEFLFLSIPRTHPFSARTAERAPIQTPLRPACFQSYSSRTQFFKLALTPITPLPPYPQVEKFLKSNAGKKIG